MNEQPQGGDQNAAAVAEQEQLQKDVEAFNGELIPLLGKYKLGLGASAFLTPDGRIAARPQVFRDKPNTEEKPAQDAPAQPAPEQPAQGEGLAEG